MNRSNMFELVFIQILGVLYPLSEDRTARESAIDQLRAVVATIKSLRGATVEPFGSFLSNLFTRWGDLDISIELSIGSHILSLSKKHKLNLLEDVHRELRRKGVNMLQLISNPRVPILKFTSDQNISCDISINNLAGHMKSKFLLWISDIDHRFRDMVLLVKEWAKTHGINDPNAGTFNSYSLCLLVIFHFQTCKPAIFPPLKEIYPTNMGEELQGVRSVVEEHFREVCAENINKFRSTREINEISLSELFMSFLEKFADISTRAKAQGISTFEGTWLDIETTASWHPKTYALMIEDPLELTENPGRTVVGSNIRRISKEFNSSYQLLSDPDLNRITLIEDMVSPTRRHLLPRYHGNVGVEGSNRRAEASPSEASSSEG